ncbi:pentatricopeptide repeat-containing protein At2g17525, mitochondrial [Vigna unguiculata]|uniref:Structure-specific endonuclease subunit SLX1 n=1 Tax=Vigna unguiculata TaxID=3917 RepID=A0A4D6LTC8_VIGUN|nr:pentatricopeptide repeat-containing protein At2g17525, mitochondrial [Vigna unguiculata]QCD91214.1 structure-specific endonuclease subunit SLX1 [Vigna unguiculata]
MHKLWKVLAYRRSSSTPYLRRFQFQTHSSTSSYSSSPPSEDHVSQLILDQKSATQALECFRWASTVPNFAHSQSTYRALIHKLCTFRRFDTVKQLLDEMPQSLGAPPNDAIFVTIIRCLGRARMIRTVIKVLDLAYKFHGSPSLKIFNSILDVLVKEDIDMAREFYRKSMMASGVEGDDYTFGILMKGLCLTNRIGEGFKLLQLIKSRGVTPNTVVYNTLLHALCRNGKVGRARSLMSEMEEPNDVTFNILISGYCKEGNSVQPLVLLEKSFSLGFVPDVVTVTKVLEILCSAGRATEAADVLERVESMGGSLDVVAYNTLIKGFCGVGKVKVGLHFLKQMESKGCLPNVDTYNALISGFCESGMLDLALDLFNDMKIDGIQWNFVTFDSLIRGLCSEGRIEDGFSILELMEESKEGSKGRISPYNSIIYGLFKQNRFDEAAEFLTKMGNMFPRAVDRSQKILEHCKKGSIEDAKRVYDEMTDEGGIPSILVYNCLVHGFSQQGSIREAVELMNEMIAHNCFPIPSTFNAVITEFCRQGKVENALKLVEDITSRGCAPNTETYSPLIDVLCRKGDLQKSMQVFREMVDKGILPDPFI